MSDKVIKVRSQAALDELLRNQSVVLLDFYAQWCGPCKALSPSLDAIAEEREDITVVKVDVDELPDVTQKYAVRGIPFVFLIQNNEVKGSFSGLQPKAAIDELINNTIVV